LCLKIELKEKKNTGYQQSKKDKWAENYPLYQILIVNVYKLINIYVY